MRGILGFDPVSLIVAAALAACIALVPDQSSAPAQKTGSDAAPAASELGRHEPHSPGPRGPAGRAMPAAKRNSGPIAVRAVGISALHVSGPAKLLEQGDFFG